MAYERLAWLPVSQLSVNRVLVREDLTPSQRADAAKIEVLRSLPDLENGAIHIESQEAWYYDASRAWRVSTMTTEQSGGGENNVSTTQTGLYSPAR